MRFSRELIDAIGAIGSFGQPTPTSGTAPAGPVTNGAGAAAAPFTSARRALKFRQAAIVYLHVTVLYEAAAYAMWRRGLLPTTRLGTGGVWLVIGLAMGLALTYALWRWHKPWLARSIWAIHALRLPTLITGAFFVGLGPRPITAGFYVTALVVVVNLWMLARAGWDV